MKEDVSQADSSDDSTFEEVLAGDRFMIHDAMLYTEVLDSSDWTEVLRREKRRKKREALAQHYEEEANERDRRDALRKKAAEDAKAVKEARKKVENAAREERETLAFRERNDDFFRRHTALLEEWIPIEKTNQAYRDRVQEQIYRRWEKNVFLPCQKEITQKVNQKCASDYRSGLAGKGGTKRKIASGRMGSETLSLSDSGPIDSRTWKDKKDELWRSFLTESNRKSRSGLFLDVIDEVEYDPIAQRKADTIRYKKRTLPISDADQQRVAAQKLEAQYSVLGLAYRDQERQSCTGILCEKLGDESELGGGPMTSPDNCSPCTSSSMAVRDMLHSRASDAVHSTLGAEDEPKEPGTLPPAPPIYRRDVHEEYQIPHTHVPYEFARKFHHRKAGSGTNGGVAESETEGSSGVAKALASHTSGLSVSPSVQRRRRMNKPMGRVDRTLTLASVTGEGQAAQTIDRLNGKWKETVEARKEAALTQRLEDRHQSPAAIEAEQKQGAKRMLECERLVMPLPLKPAPAPPTEFSKQLMPWMTTGGRAPINERGHYLPVNSWGASRIAETVYGHYVHPDGSQRPSPENKIDGGYRIHESNVSFDHFNYPQESEAPKTGKRMCVYYQL